MLGKAGSLFKTGSTHGLQCGSGSQGRGGETFVQNYLDEAEVLAYKSADVHDDLIGAMI